MIQWIIVVLILAAALLWIIRKFICRKKNGGCNCCDSTSCPLNKPNNQ
ncbi:MAG: FeoB-associated Cys-rich membrane protein [Muribaculaceae bacterium]|nr:FeoB-associated Cys-rich membrane protein [Muribaculaceae bacterium]